MCFFCANNSPHVIKAVTHTHTLIYHIPHVLSPSAEGHHIWLQTQLPQLRQLLQCLRPSPVEAATRGGNTLAHRSGTMKKKRCAIPSLGLQLYPQKVVRPSKPTPTIFSAGGWSPRAYKVFHMEWSHSFNKEEHAVFEGIPSWNSRLFCTGELFNFHLCS